MDAMMTHRCVLCRRLPGWFFETTSLGDTMILGHRFCEECARILAPALIVHLAEWGTKGIQPGATKR